MGLGGELLWTPILREIHRRRGKPVKLYARPKLSDLLVGTKYDRAMTRLSSPVFNNNPHVSSNECIFKNHFSKKIDAWFESILELCHLRKVYDNYWYYYSKKHGFEFIYLDLPHHSYAERDLRFKYIWKKGEHIIDILGESVCLDSLPHKCELYIDSQEEEKVNKLISQLNLRYFIAIEPNTNTDYFGDFRAWPFARWQQIVYRVRSEFPEIKIVQVGVEGSCALDGTVQVCGLLTFRETALLMKKSKLFLGTEGGLVHAANAMESKAVVVWSGVTLPEFAGYPGKHDIVYKRVECSPCGLKGNCPNAHLCMQSISVDDVWVRIKQTLMDVD